MLLRQPSFVESAPLQSSLKQLAGIIDASTHISQFNNLTNVLTKLQNEKKFDPVFWKFPIHLLGCYSLVRLVMPNTEELISQPLEGL